MKKSLDIIYSKQPADVCSLDIYRPYKVTKPTLIIYAHGGGFYNGSRKGEDSKVLAELFTSHGYEFVTFGYRLATSMDSFPLAQQKYIEKQMQRSAKRGVSIHPRLYGPAFFAAVQDGSAAINYLNKSKKKHKLTYDKICFVGVSAGAILGLSLAYTNGKFIPSDTAPDMVISIAGAFVEPWNMRVDGPPVLMFHGIRDRIIGVGNTNRTQKRAGNICAPFQAIITNTGHIDQLDNVLSGYSETGYSHLSHMFDFIENSVG